MSGELSLPLLAAVRDPWLLPRCLPAHNQRSSALAPWKQPPLPTPFDFKNHMP